MTISHEHPLSQLAAVELDACLLSSLNSITAHIQRNRTASCDRA